MNAPMIVSHVLSEGGSSPGCAPSVAPPGFFSADEINTEHQLAQKTAGIAVKHAVKCGELLISVKAGLKHGEFMPWIEQNCRFPQSTASLYMKAAKQISNGLEISALRGIFPSGKIRRTDTQVGEIEDHADDDVAVSYGAKIFGISRRMILDAMVIKEQAPELMEQIESGKLSIKKALQIMRRSASGLGGDRGHQEHHQDGADHDADHDVDGADPGDADGAQVQVLAQLLDAWETATPKTRLDFLTTAHIHDEIMDVVNLSVASGKAA